MFFRRVYVDETTSDYNAAIRYSTYYGDRGICTECQGERVGASLGVSCLTSCIFLVMMRCVLITALAANRQHPDCWCSSYYADAGDLCV